MDCPLLTVVALVVTASAEAPEREDPRPTCSRWTWATAVLLTLPRPPRSVAITDPQVASITFLGESEVWWVQGLAVGTSDLGIHLRGDDPIFIYDIALTRNVGHLRRAIDRAVGPQGSPPQVTGGAEVCGLIRTAQKWVSTSSRL